MKKFFTTKHEREFFSPHPIFKLAPHELWYTTKHENNSLTLGGETPPLLLLYEKPLRVYTPSLLHSLFSS